MGKKKWFYLIGDVMGVILASFIFIIPYAFMFVNSLKERREANLLRLSWPKELHWENYLEVFKANNYQILTAFKNSGILVTGAVVVLIFTGSMCGYILQRRRDKAMTVVNSLIMAGLMVPAAILPTIWVLQKIGLYKSLPGMIFVEVALQIPFTVMLYRGFMGSIPTELEEAGYIDGCNAFHIFRLIIFPLLKPVTATVVILNAVTIFNDFTNPLYFLPGAKNATVQLTLYNFMGQYSSSYNMLFADVILITVPMLILFIFFNKRIVEGMVAGAVKG